MGMREICAAEDFPWRTCHQKVNNLWEAAVDFRICRTSYDPSSQEYGGDDVEGESCAPSGGGVLGVFDCYFVFGRGGDCRAVLFCFEEAGGRSDAGDRAGADGAGS